MGQWFAAYLAKTGRQVVITGRDQAKLKTTGAKLGVPIATNIEAVKSSDIVLLSVSIDGFEAVVKEIAPFIRPEQVIIDLTSVKVLPVEVMHKYLKTAVTLGVHPMFGPGASDVKGQSFVLTPTSERETQLAKKVESFLKAESARVIITTPEEHDRLMAVILGFAHFIAFVSGETLVATDVLKKTRAVGGKTYNLLLTLVEAVASEDAEFYASLQTNLPYLGGIETLFSKKAEEWSELVRKKDKEQLVRKMHELRQNLEREGADFAGSYENMYRLSK